MNHTIKFHSPDGPAFNPGQRWLAADGSKSVATIVSTNRYGPSKWDVDVRYNQDDNPQLLTKDAYSFQVRRYHEADRFV